MPAPYSHRRALRTPTIKNAGLLIAIVPALYAVHPEGAAAGDAAVARAASAVEASAVEDGAEDGGFFVQRWDGSRARVSSHSESSHTVAAATAATCGSSEHTADARSENRPAPICAWFSVLQLSSQSACTAWCGCKGGCGCGLRLGRG